ncbi:MAG: hypothetical protein AB8A46_03440 [Prochlorococcus sp.]|jgi:hypothetical protein|nr:hypothetical protein [Prochlorococcus sp.]MDP6193535.1 hypothetical protein [Prochlorococcaceae cyanobacterium ETNP18_MAG_1]CAI8158988.1 MAG: Uncharacterised protein [Prochlorococcus marinus str. MIT 9215]
MAFPIPCLLSSIEDLLQEVEWLDGLILVTDSQRALFVPFTQVQPVLQRLRERPNGHEVAERLCMALLDVQAAGGGAKPVLVMQDDGRFWLGMMGIHARSPQRKQAVEHLQRCLSLCS